MEDELESYNSLEHSFPSCPVEKGRYKNPYLHDTKRRFVDFLKWRFGRFPDRHPKVLAPSTFNYPNPEEVDEAKPKATWINHSSFLVSYKNFHLITDPIWSKRCSPSKLIGPKRLHEPPLALDEMQHLSLVLISHNHFDHLDKKSVLRIFKMNKKALFVVPIGVKRWFTKRGIKNVVEIDWWQSTFAHFEDFPDLSVQITAVPSQHFSGRGLFDKNKSLWCGFVIKLYEEGVHQKTLYFVGDTGYNPYDFKNIGEAFGKMDLSLIPIGTYLPYSFMAPVHICPEKAVKIHMEVNSKLSIGMHWKTFKLSEEMIHQPPYDLYENMIENGLDPLTFRVIHPGQSINW